MGLLQDQKDSSRFANQSMQYNVIQHTNKRKDKNHMIISINAEKKHLIKFKFIHVKNSHYSEYRGNISQQYKSHYDKPTANFILNVKIWKTAASIQEQNKDAQSLHFYLT